jgi:nuclear receptor subfamily 1 group I
VCQVCGDKALGYNFNAITCESCKAFFRRNALANKEFTCPFSKHCDITVVTRRFCQKCRLDKCFAIGMKKEFIMTDEDKQIKRQKVELNRARKRQGRGDGRHVNDAVNSPDTTTSEPQAPSSKVVKLEKEEVAAPFSQFTSVITSTVNLNVPLDALPMPTIESSASEIVQRIIGAPNQAGKVINSLMTTPENALHVMSKIVSSQGEALQLINHFIQCPSDALQVISEFESSF